ncbi:MAG TPA: Fe-S protein assembly co-chaperone HscB [Hyphomicrobiales bacterium]|nr:Fe-S protein assembly co-chaperone HscB [Hyphomicrobiales bacterium]
MSTESTILSYFALLGLDELPTLDRAALEDAYRRLQSRWHPDQFAGADEVTRARAMRQTSLINDAYTTLRDPVGRAGHLLALRGLDPTRLEQHELAPDFLLSQISWREELEAACAASDEAALLRLDERVEQAFHEAWRSFSTLLRTAELAGAKREFHKLQFLNKLQREIAEAEAALLDD